MNNFLKYHFTFNHLFFHLFTMQFLFNSGSRHPIPPTPFAQSKSGLIYLLDASCQVLIRSIRKRRFRIRK